MFCSKCGSQMSDEMRFCPVCGNEVAPQPVGGATSSVPASPSTQSSSWTMAQPSQQTSYTSKRPTDPDTNKRARNKRDVKRFIGIIGTLLGIMFIIFAQMLKSEAGDYWWSGSYSELMSASSTMMGIGLVVLAIGVLLLASMIYAARTTEDETTRTRKLVKLKDGVGFDKAKESFDKHMRYNGYSQTTIKDQSCWVKGDGIITPRRAFSLLPARDGVIIEAWATDAITGSDNIDGGFLGLVQLRQARELLTNLAWQVESAK